MTQSISALRPGRHTLTQTTPDGWTLESVTCDNGVTTEPIENGVAIELTGYDTTCTFTNAPVGGTEPTPTPTNTPEPTPTPTLEPTPTNTIEPTIEPTPTPLPPTPTNTAVPQPTVAPTSAPTTCGPLFQEAEVGILAGHWAIGDDPTASGGQFIFTPDNDEQVTRSILAETTINRHKASYCFTVSEAGTYRIMGWVYAEDGQDDSVFVTLNGQPADGYIWDLPINTSYRRDYASSRDDDGTGTAQLLEFNLEPGEHTVDLYRREDGTRIDKIALVLVDGTEPVLGPPTPANCAPLGNEAENGTLYGSFVVGDDPSASGGQFVMVPESDGLRAASATSAAAQARNRADYCVTVPEAGDYRIRTQVMGPTHRANSFFVQVNGLPQEAILYPIYPVGTDYTTDYVGQRGGDDPVIISLGGGEQTISFILREDGARLDSFALEPVTVKAMSLPATTAAEIQRDLQAEEEEGVAGENTSETTIMLPMIVQ